MALFFKKDLEAITEGDYDRLIDHLEAKGKVDYNYRKVTKKFFRWLKEDEDIPVWVRKITLPHEESPVQPGDLRTKGELDKLLNACTHPRDKALVAVAIDSMMRIGALGTLRVKSPIFNYNGAVLYMSSTSQNLKTTTPRPIPLTWSTGFLNQWLSIHPCKDDPEAPLWPNLKGKDKYKAMSYNTLRKTLLSIKERAGLKGRIFFHLFRHQKVTDMLLNGFPVQQIEYQAGWVPGSGRMLKVYGNFTGEDMVKAIYAQHGLEVEEKQVTLEKCPRCHVILVPEARVCHQCALVLDKGMGKELEDKGKLIPEVFAALQCNPEFQKLFAEAIAKSVK
jgi:integrase/recombinase XerD